MSVLMKRASELAERVGKASGRLALDESGRAAHDVVDEVRDAVAAMTLSELDEVHPRLLDLLQNGLLKAWQASDSGDGVDRRTMRLAVEQIRQALWEISEGVPVSPDRPSKDVARWLVEALHVPHARLAEALGVSPRTLGRWIAEDGSEPSGSDELRLRVLAAVVANLRHTLTGPGVLLWLEQPHPSLRDEAPADLLADDRRAPELISLAAATRAHVAT